MTALLRQTRCRLAKELRLHTGCAARLYLLTILVMASACGPTRGEVVPPSRTVVGTVTVPPGLPVVIALAASLTPAELQYLDGKIAEFEDVNTDIRVDVVGLGIEAAGASGKMRALLSAGDASVDLVLVDRRLAAELCAEGRIAVQPQAGGAGRDGADWALVQRCEEQYWIALPSSALGEGRGFAVSAFSRHSEAATRFAQYIVSEEKDGSK